MNFATRSASFGFSKLCHALANSGEQWRTLRASVGSHIVTGGETRFATAPHQNLQMWDRGFTLSIHEQPAIRVRERTEITPQCPAVSALNSEPVNIPIWLIPLFVSATIHAIVWCSFQVFDGDFLGLCNLRYVLALTY